MEGGLIAAHLQDAIWVTGVLVFALVFLWFAREDLLISVRISKPQTLAALCNQGSHLFCV